MEETYDESIYEIDLHGMNMSEAKIVLDEVFEYMLSEDVIRELHIVVGKGKGSETGPVLPSFVGNYVKGRGLMFEGVGGVIRVFK